MTNRFPDDQVIAVYLLGGLSDEETERLDELSITDDEFAGRLEAVEYDLLDAYVKNQLPAEHLTRFKSRFLASPRRRERLQVSESFLTTLDKRCAMPEGSLESSTPSGRRDLSAWPFWRNRRLTVWGLAAVVVMMLTAAYLLFENQALRNEIGRGRSERAALEDRERELQRQLDDQESGGAETEKELAQVRERLSILEKRLTTSESTNRHQPRVVALNLSPQTRGMAQPPTLVIPSGTDSVALNLELEGIGFSAYRAELKNAASGQTIWRSGRLTTSETKKAILVSPPVSLLKPRIYLLQLSGVSSTGEENVGTYSFRVTRQ